MTIFSIINNVVFRRFLLLLKMKTVKAIHLNKIYCMETTV